MYVHECVCILCVSMYICVWGRQSLRSCNHKAGSWICNPNSYHLSSPNYLKLNTQSPRLVSALTCKHPGAPQKPMEILSGGTFLHSRFPRPLPQLSPQGNKHHRAARSNTQGLQILNYRLQSKNQLLKTLGQIFKN